MGIDPNNHRLSHNLPRPLHMSNTSSDATTLTGLKLSCGTAAQEQQLAKSRADINCDQVSDAGSCLEDDSCGLPDLNLDLTIGNIPFTQISTDHVE